MIQIDGAPRICIWLHLIFSADFASPNMIKCGAWSTEPPRAGVSNNNLIFQEGINTAYSTGHQLWRPPLTSYWQTFIFPAETHLGHSVYFNTAVTSPEILGKLRFWTKKRARSISYNHIKMMQSMVYLISLFMLILIKWHVTSPEILEEWVNKY